MWGRVREAKGRCHSKPQKVNTWLCSAVPTFLYHGRVQMKSLIGPFWISFHQTPARFKANKAKVGKTVKCWKSPPRTCVSSFPGLLSSFGSQQFYQAQDHPPSVSAPAVTHWALLPVPPGRALTFPMVPLVQAFTKAFCYPPWQSGNALHRGTPQVHCHSQKQILPEGFNFLFSLFAELLCRYLWRQSTTCLQANSSWGQLPAPISAAMDTLHKTIWLSRSVSCSREPLGWWEGEGGKPVWLPPGELNSL